VEEKRPKINCFVSVGALADVLEELFDEVITLRTTWDPETVSVVVFPADNSTTWEGRLYYVQTENEP
jgi:hypothetical protein